MNHAFPLFSGGVKDLSALSYVWLVREEGEIFKLVIKYAYYYIVEMWLVKSNH